MAKALRIPAIFSIDPTPAPRLHRWMMLGARLLFWPLALLALVGLVLHLGAWQKEFKFAGPFAADTNPARHSLILAVPQEGRAPWWRQPLLGDSIEKPFESLLELHIDGRKLGPAHSQHETIREGKTSGFSHWGAYVIFSLPPNVKNAPETVATLSYSIRPRSWMTSVLAVAGTLLGWILYHQQLRRYWALTSRARRYAEPLTAAILRIPYLAMMGVVGVGLTASALYLLSSLYALGTGWALPTTAPIRWSPIAQWAARNVTDLGYLVLMLAGFGASVTWLFGATAQHRRSIETDELKLRSILRWCGFPITACAFILCISTIWSGSMKTGGGNFAHIGGLVPFSDAANYLTAAHDQAKDGYWNFVALHRPLAAAFRSVLLVFSNFSLQLMLILQACLIAGAICFATHAVAKWRGVWAATAFFALTYIYDRDFVQTTLTEPLGLFWALLSIPFFIEAFVTASVRPALVAFAIATIALMTRMGSMFTIPALLVWLVWQFGRGAKAKLRIFATATCILLGILGLNSVLQKAYGTANEGSTTGNFAYVLCGLTLGTDWRGCQPKLSSEGKTLQAGEEAFTKHLYSMAWENFRAKPAVFFGRLADGAGEFVTEFPNIIWKGYAASNPEPAWLWRNSLTAVFMIGLLYTAARRAKAIELTFWALLWASIVASSSIIYFDDGSRTLAASHPLIALFLAMGMCSPVLVPTVSSAHSRLSRYGSLGLIVSAALFVCIPWMAHRFSPVGAMTGDGLLPKQDEAFVFGGRRMSGFLVVEDGDPLRNDVPTLHLSDFDTIVNQSNVEFYQDLIHPVMPPLPFGFVFAPRLETTAQSRYQYIVPAEVIERPDVPAWHFQLKQWGYRPGGYGEYWFYVTKAEPWRR